MMDSGLATSPASSLRTRHDWTCHSSSPLPNH